jgi:radical SAM superfamily enzyme YgiQ (UPF0313 family)
MAVQYKKVLLVASAQLPYDRPPPALAFLAGICEANTIDYEILDLNLHILQTLGKTLWNETYGVTSNMSIDCDEDSELMAHINHAAESAVNKILSYNPDLIAVTSFSAMQIAWTRKLLEKLRERSNVTVIAGGPGISYEQLPGKTAGRILADANLLNYYVLGEGDFSFDNFLKGTIDLGVNSNKQPWENWVPQIDNLDSIIFPTYKKINLDDYDPPIKDNPTLGILGSRGCVRRCTFCDIGHIWKKFRFRSADNIASEMIKHYQETGITNFSFTDSLINGSLKQFNELMNKIIDMRNTVSGFNNVQFAGQFIIREARHHPESIFKLMKESGCKNLSVGIETGSDTVRFHMGKKFTNVDIDYHMEMCEKYGIENTFLVFTGYPTETLQDHQDTVEMIKRYQKYLINDTMILISLASPMVIYKNTPIDVMREQLGIHVYNNEYESLDWVSDSNPDLTLNERYRRYIELVKLTVELRYPRLAEDLVFLESHIKAVMHVQQRKEIK